MAAKKPDKPDTTRKPRAFPVGMRVRLHPSGATGKIARVPDFDTRIVRLGDESERTCKIGELSEIA